MTLYDFSLKLKEFNQNNAFSECLNYFKDNETSFHPNQIRDNSYVVNDIISAYIGSNDYQSIFNFIEQYQVKLEPKNFPFLLKKFKDKPTVNWNIVNQFCDLVNVTDLDTSCKTIETIRKGVAKPMELASAKENWFAYKTKALYEIQQYEACFNLSKIALETFDKFHYSNDIWFARRIALSKIQLGNTDEALNELLLILKKKREWFIESEIATIYKDKLEFEKALKYAISGLNNFGDIEYKVGLIELTAELLLQKNDKNLAFKYFSFSKLLRTKMEWGIPNNLVISLSQFDDEEIKVDKLNSLKRELSVYWQSLNVLSLKPKKDKLKDTEKINGQVNKILHNDEKGMDGFITYGGRKSIYFSLRKDHSLIPKIKVGTNMNFNIILQKEIGKEKAYIIEVI